MIIVIQKTISVQSYINHVSASNLLGIIHDDPIHLYI